MRRLKKRRRRLTKKTAKKMTKMNRTLRTELEGRVFWDDGLGEEIAAEEEEDEAQGDLEEAVFVEALDRPFLDLFDVDHALAPLMVCATN